ncbi:hypothetical protein KHA80_02310 [Anaerobacillus sp. HL2]|nr:hypothetical protein KHA80_02310 [Anaerobacillus sp. HL2]
MKVTITARSCPSMRKEQRMKVTITARSCPSMRRRKDEGNDYGKIVPFNAKNKG